MPADAKSSQRKVPPRRSNTTTNMAHGNGYYDLLGVEAVADMTEIKKA